MAPHATDYPEALRADRTRSPKADQAERGHRSLPVPDPGLSYWHRTTRAFKHLDENRTESVPATAKYIILGSGLSGSLTAWTLVESGCDASSIIILEAREAVSGASGRNAGHVRPDAFRGFAAYSRIHGKEQAKKIVENEKLVFEEVEAFIVKHQVPCDFNSSTTFDVCLTPEFAAYEKESLEAFKSAGGDVSHVKYFDGDVARERTKVKDAICAYEWPAGSIHPAKLTQYMLSSLIERGMKLFTYCPATSISESSSGVSRWAVNTPRGAIETDTVVHCTNAYAAYLLPELASFLTPNRAQAHSFVPTSALSGSKALSTTSSLRYSLRHFFSFIQRKGDGTVIFGTSRENPHWSQGTKDSIVTFDDTAYNSEVSNTAEQTFMALFPDATSKGVRHGEGADHHWTGIIAMTPDSVPMVGEIEGKKGQWICAGHNGHGMARIWTCAPGLAKLILGEPWSSTGLPECFQYSNARLDRAMTQEVKSVW